MGVATMREATANSPRVLLLFSALMVMMSTQTSLGHPLIYVAILLLAAVATGIALLHPGAMREGTWQRRWEWLLVVLMVLTGVIRTAGMLAQALGDIASPVWVTVIAVYTILGMAGGFLTARGHLGWIFTLFLMVHTAMAVVLLRSMPGLTDVQIYLHDGVAALLHGHNPYHMTIRNIYPADLAVRNYGPGVVVDGRVNAGFPYLPLALLVTIPGFLSGDVIYGSLVAMLVTAVVLRRLASDRVGRAVAVLGVASISAIPVLINAWTETTSVALLACLVLALEGRRHAYTALFLGLLLVSKQYFVLVVPILWLIRQWLTRNVILIAVGLAAAVTLPLFMVDPAAFWSAVASSPGAALRPDSLSLLVFSVNTFGWPPPWIHPVLPLLGGGLTAIVLALHAPRTPAAFSAGVGLTLLVMILLSNRGFMNYYFLVSGAFLIAAVAWPMRPGPANPVNKTPA